MNLCAKCNINPAIVDPIKGVFPYCTQCQNTLHSFNTKVPEFTSENIKEQRLMRRTDIIQPHYKGHLNKEWVDIHGVKKAKERGYSEKEIKEAKYVYNGGEGESYYNKY